MNVQGLNRVEELCLIVYGGKKVNSEVTAEAHKVLLALQTSSTFLPQVQFLLLNSKTPYSLLYGINSMLNIIQKDWKNVPISTQKELIPFLLTFLVEGNHGDVKFILNAAIRCLCRVVREGWMSNKEFHGIFDEVKKLLDSTSRKHCLLGLQIVSTLVTEFDVTNSENGINKPLTHNGISTYGYRVVARYDASKRLLSQAFREQGLNKVFQISLAFIDKAKENNIPDVLQYSLEVLLACLEFDFVGTGQGLSDESVSCLYIPMEWAEKVARDKSVSRLFEIYNTQWSDSDSTNETQRKASATLCLKVLCMMLFFIYIF